ncbi:hypothetical protein [Pantoea stewartii]|uniref:hypothetical protein n=1 Tax=Pantoea stewartii TaxID=66269 RepID=UPI0014793CC0|nr:hypothetical protein [Pantoea stewartii]
MRCIVLLNVDDPDNTSIAQDKNGDNWVFNNYNDADDWCSRNAGGTWLKVINLDDDDDD